MIWTHVNDLIWELIEESLWDYDNSAAFARHLEIPLHRELQDLRVVELGYDPDSAATPESIFMAAGDLAEEDCQFHAGRIEKWLNVAGRITKKWQAEVSYSSMDGWLRVDINYCDKPSLSCEPARPKS